jgi:predicted nucleic acid-binding protein
VILLDTSVLIERDISSLDQKQNYAASIFSRAELEFGASVATGDEACERRTRLAFLDQRLEWLAFDEGSTHAYGTVAAAVHPHAPAQARRIDTYIAAQAYQHGVPLMTLNLADFRHLSALVDVILPPSRESRPGPRRGGRGA